MWELGLLCVAIQTSRLTKVLLFSKYSPLVSLEVISIPARRGKKKEKNLEDRLMGYLCTPRRQMAHITFTPVHLYVNSIDPIYLCRHHELYRTRKGSQKTKPNKANKQNTSLYKVPLLATTLSRLILLTSKIKIFIPHGNTVSIELC